MSHCYVAAASARTFMSLPDTHVQLQKTCREFTNEEIVPVAAKMDREKVFPKEIIKKMGSLGLMAISIPEKEGGAGVSVHFHGMLSK